MRRSMLAMRKSRRIFMIPPGDTAVFDPATLSLSAWWRTDYAGAPWSGTASGGASGSRTLTATGDASPITGTTLNGLTVANFVAATGHSLQGIAGTNYLTLSAGTAIMLVRVPSAAASGGAHNDPALWQFGGSCLLTFSTSGAQFCIFDGAQKTVTVSCNTADYHALVMRWNGTTLRGQVDRRAESTAACGNINALGSTLIVGKLTGVAFVDEMVAEFMFASTELADADVNNVLSYFESRYNLTLPTV